MKEGPDIALLGSLIGDPARANMLTALMSGKALTASEMAVVSGITVQTASAHLKKLESGGLIYQRKQGRHRYFSLSDDDVGSLLETMMGLAAKKGHMRVRTGPKDPALRKARICYNHLAGEMGVQLYDSLTFQDLITTDEMNLSLTRNGLSFMEEFGIDTALFGKTKRPVCKSCLDWSARRSHMAGALGTKILDRFYDLGWAKREVGTRIINFTDNGNVEFQALFPVN